MNERIRELATKARIQMCSDARLQEFAELIVRECTVIMYEDTTPNVPYVNAFDVANKIKEHFGVE